MLLTKPRQLIQDFFEAIDRQWFLNKTSWVILNRAVKYVLLIVLPKAI